MGLLRDLGTPTEAAEYDGNKARIVALCNALTGRSGRPANGPPASYRGLTMILTLMVTITMIDGKRQPWFIMDSLL